MDTVQIIWLVLVVVFAIAEGVTVGLISGWFCVGAIVALLVSLIAPGAVGLQVVLFLIVSVLLLLGLRPMARKLIDEKRVPTNADASIGKVAQVLNEVQPGRFGRVKLEGKEWTARSDSVLPAGSWCHVDGIEGVKLVVSPLPPEQPGQPQ